MAFELALGLTRFGIHPGSTAASEAIFTLLNEGLVGSSFGTGVQRITLDIHLPWRGAPPQPFGPADIRRYHDFLAKMPKVTFQKKRERAIVQWATDLDTKPLLVTADEVSRATFESLATEVQRALASLRPRLARIRDFDFDGLIAAVDAAVAAVPNDSAGLCAMITRTQVAAHARWAAARRAMDPWEALDVDWGTYHPRARELLDDPFFWECADDLAPVGNDTGADVLEDYRSWRKRSAKAKDALGFLHELLGRWEVSVEVKQPKNERETASALVRDEAFVALAFAQLMLDGSVDANVADAALEAIERQSRTTEDWPDPAKRRATLQKMGGAIERSRR